MRELLLTGARVLTMDPAHPRAEAVLVRGERIMAAGSTAELSALASPQARRLELGGRCLIPGFNDNHLHALSMGEYFSRVRVHGLGPREILEVLRERFAGARAGEILWAYGWDSPQVPAPHRSFLDEAFPDNPVVLYQFSGHAAWVNTAMLARLGIRRDTPDPVGGEIARGPDGEPSGILRDAAIYPLHLKRMRRHVFDRGLRARLLDGRLLFDLSKPTVVKVFEQMKRVHYQKRTSPTKGEYYEYHRADDDLVAALENAVTVIDGGPSPLPTSYTAPGALRRANAGARMEVWLP